MARGKGSRPKRRGLVGVGEEAMEEFYKAARSVSVVKSEEQVTIEEQYFADSFRCPDFSQYDKQFQGFLADDIIEKSHKYALEKAGGRSCCLDQMHFGGVGCAALETHLPSAQI